MKQVLYILGFVLATLLFYGNSEMPTSLSPNCQKDDAVMQETCKKNKEQCLIVLSNDLKNSNLINSRRIVQSVSYNFNIRILSQTEKHIQYIRLKGFSALAKLFEVKAVEHFTNYNALLCDNGYHVFALRKLLI